MTKTNTYKNFIPISEEQLKEIERTEERKNIDWFRKHNAKAYMVLLD